MNKSMVQHLLHYRIRLRPIPRRIWQGLEQEPIDYVWLVDSVSPQGEVRISNANGHFVSLGSDHIREYTSDHQSETDGLNHGFLVLKGHLTFEDGRLRVEPTPRATGASANKPPNKRLARTSPRAS
jgi:hypothetical protein